MEKDLGSYRKSYEKKQLIESNIGDNPMELFQKWFYEIDSNFEIDETNAMTLSTMGLDGYPKSRVVLLKRYTYEGFIFYSNYESEKGKAIEQNPNVCISFFWHAAERQIIIKGKAERIAENLSDGYFESRPRGSQLGAVVSKQSDIIANREFLAQTQVAESVLNLCDDEIAKILNGKVIPGDRVFYPVKPHIGTTTPGVHQPDFSGKSVVFTVDGTDKTDAERVEFLAQHVEKNGGKVACFISQSTPKEVQESISSKFHSHIVNITNPEEVQRWLNTAKTNLGEILGVIHVTGKLPEIEKLTELTRSAWEELTEKFISTPATVAQRALEHFVPGGDKDPRLYKDTKGAIMIIGPDLPVGRKVTGTQRAQVEVFRGALRPFTTTVNQELSDVLKSKIRMFTIFPGSVTGSEPNNQKIADAFNFLVTENSASSAEVTFCVDETR